MPRPDLRSTLLALLGLLVSAVAITLLAKAIDVAATGRLLATANPLPVATAVAILAAGVTLRIYRWTLLLPTRRRDGRVPVRRLAGPLLVGYLANVLLPARLGEGVRAATVWRRERIGLSETLGSVTIERVLDTSIIGVLGFAAAWWLRAPLWILSGTAIVALVATGVIAVLVSGIGSRLANRLKRWPRIAARVDGFLWAASIPDRRIIPAAVALTAAAWILDALIVWLAAASLSIPVAFPAAVIISAVGVLGTAIPAAPGYVGTYELAASAAGTALGFPPEVALALALLVHATNLIPLTVAGLVALITLGGRNDVSGMDYQAGGR